MSKVQCLKDILSTYSSVSAQKVNFSKSTAYFSPRTLSAHRVAVHDALGVQEVDDPGIYLGVPLLIGKNKYAAFGRYRDKVDTRALPQYVMSCYLLPCSLVEEMSRSIRRFWWSGKGSARGWPLVAWDDICLPKTASGIGFKDLHLFNIALLGKQIWRLLSATGSLLYRTLHAKYFPDGDLLRASAPARSSFAWKGLHCAMFCLRDGFYWTLGVDSQVRLFRDRWGVSPLLPLLGIPLTGRRFLFAAVNSWSLGKPVGTNVVVLCLDYASASAPPQVPPPIAADPPRWRPPPAGSVKINVDGAFLSLACLGAIGVIACDSSGAVLGGFAKPVPVHGPTSTVEVSALFAGLEFAIANDWPSALIESDPAPCLLPMPAVFVLASPLVWPTLPPIRLPLGLVTMIM
ncbi:hypothetical protein GQ457_02G043490 [Hibiscus cannabinus]